MRARHILACLLLAAPALAASGGDYATGVAAFAAGDIRGAQAALFAALQANPADARAHLLQGRVYLLLGDGVGAEAELRRAVDAGTPSTEVHHLLADALLLEDSPDRALAEADQAPPRFALYATRMRGRALAALDRSEEARANFEKAVRIAPGSLTAWADLAGFRADAGDGAGALAAANRALAIDPRAERWERPAALVLKGRLVRRQYGLTAALPWFDRAHAVDKGNGPALIERAATLGDLGRAREAVATTRAAIALGGNDAAAFYLQAVIAARAKDWRLARVLLGRVGDALDDQPGAILLSGTVELQTGNVEQAIGGLSRLVDLQPANIKARRLLALAQWRAGDASAALEALQPVLDGADADSWSLALAGRALERLGDRVAAAAYLDRAMRLLPAPPPTADVEEAQRGVALSPGDLDAQFALVRGLAFAGRGADAFAAARAIEVAQPGLPDAHLATGDVLMASGRAPEAVDAYARAADIAFGEPVALRLIDALHRSRRERDVAQVLNVLLAQYPRSIAGRLAVADVVIRARGWGQAVALLEGVEARLGGSDPVLRSALAWAYANGGHVDRALAEAETARQIAPASPTVNGMLGWLLWRTGRDRSRGLALLAEAAGQAPEDAGIAAHLAKARAG